MDIRPAIVGGALCAFILASSATAREWKEDLSRDEMRGETIRIVRTESEDRRAQFAVRRKNDRTDFMLTVPGEVITDCDDQDALIKFDDGKILPLMCDGSPSETVFVNYSIFNSKFLDAIAKSRRMIIEVHIYPSSTAQFIFDVAGFNPDGF